MSWPRPLAGIRVVDFGQLTAGANTAAMLADLGADVIKVESGRYLDLFRIIGRRDSESGWWNRSPQFRFTNRNKRGVAIDLKTAEGRQLVRDLVAGCDIVVENFRRGVLERLGLDYASISAANPRIILASITSQGEDGPQRLYGSFGSTLDATGGLAALTGYPDDKPVISGSDINYPDQVVSLFAVGMILAAVRERRRTGRGAQLDISQREVTSFLIGEEILAASAGAGAHRRQGNAADGVLLQDCFHTADGRWLALTVTDDADAARLRAVVGSESILRAATAAWCAQRAADEAARALAAEGLAAAPVLDGLDMLRERELAGHTLLWTEHGLVKGAPYSFGGQPPTVDRLAPDLGEHTETVLGEVLGLDEHALQQLQNLGVTRAEPPE